MPSKSEAIMPRFIDLSGSVKPFRPSGLGGLGGLRSSLRRGNRYGTSSSKNYAEKKVDPIIGGLPGDVQYVVNKNIDRYGTSELNYEKQSDVLMKGFIGEFLKADNKTEREAILAKADHGFNVLRKDKAEYEINLNTIKLNEYLFKRAMDVSKEYGDSPYISPTGGMMVYREDDSGKYDFTKPIGVTPNEVKPRDVFVTIDEYNVRKAGMAMGDPTTGLLSVQEFSEGIDPKILRTEIVNAVDKIGKEKIKTFEILNEENYLKGGVKGIKKTVTKETKIKNLEALSQLIGNQLSPQAIRTAQREYAIYRSQLDEKSKPFDFNKWLGAKVSSHAAVDEYSEMTEIDILSAIEGKDAVSGERDYSGTKVVQNPREYTEFTRPRPLVVEMGPITKLVDVPVKIIPGLGQTDYRQQRKKILNIPNLVDSNGKPRKAQAFPKASDIFNSAKTEDGNTIYFDGKGIDGDMIEAYVVDISDTYAMPAFHRREGKLTNKPIESGETVVDLKTLKKYPKYHMEHYQKATVRARAKDLRKTNMPWFRNVDGSLRKEFIHGEMMPFLGSLEDARSSFPKETFNRMNMRLVNEKGENLSFMGEVFTMDTWVEFSVCYPLSKVSMYDFSKTGGKKNWDALQWEKHTIDLINTQNNQVQQDRKTIPDYEKHFQKEESDPLFKETFVTAE